ncbi:MAG TPA: ester cyclase, partial [Blastocatellia bacterium]|nr:ester cyclase [Blastocatellia bacterium]
MQAKALNKAIVIKPQEMNKTIIREMIEAIGQKGFAAQADFFAERCMNHGMPVTRDAVRAVLQDIATTFPDARLEPLAMVAEGDWVVLRCFLSGTHRGLGQHPFVHEGVLAGVPP